MSEEYMDNKNKEGAINNTGDTATNTGDVSATGDIDTANWKKGLPEEYQSYVKDIKDLPSLVKSYAEAQSFIGRSIRVPGEDAGAEDKQAFVDKLMKHAPGLVRMPSEDDPESYNAFWSSVGVPTDHTGYTIDGDLPQEINPEWLEQMKPLAKKYGLTKKQFGAYAKDRIAEELQNAKESAEAQEASLMELKGEWGLATKDKINDVYRFAKEMDMPESFIKALEGNQVSKEWIKAVDKIIQQFGGMKEGSNATFTKSDNVMDTPQEMEYKIKEIEANPAYRDRKHPLHKSLIEKRIKYLQDINKSKARQ